MAGTASRFHTACSSRRRRVRASTSSSQPSARSRCGAFFEGPSRVELRQEGVQLFDMLDAGVAAAAVGERPEPFMAYSGAIGDLAQGCLAALVEQLYRARKQGFCRIRLLLHAKQCSL